MKPGTIVVIRPRISVTLLSTPYGNFFERNVVGQFMAKELGFTIASVHPDGDLHDHVLVLTSSGLLGWAIEIDCKVVR